MPTRYPPSDRFFSFLRETGNCILRDGQMIFFRMAAILFSTSLVSTDCLSFSVFDPTLGKASSLDSTLLENGRPLFDFFLPAILHLVENCFSLFHDDGLLLLPFSISLPLSFVLRPPRLFPSANSNLIPLYSIVLLPPLSFFPRPVEKVPREKAPHPLHHCFSVLKMRTCLKPFLPSPRSSFGSTRRRFAKTGPQ